VCNGAGVCAAATTSSCGAYTCDPLTSACRANCTAAARLRRAQHLQRATLHAQADRSRCTTAERVRLRLLRAGVLLQSRPARGTCKSCAITGSLGPAATSPTAPRRRRPLSARRRASTTCGLDGVCNGAGACRYWATARSARPGPASDRR
jgi:hypothetical protein